MFPRFGKVLILHKGIIWHGNLLLCMVLCCNRDTLRFSRRAESEMLSVPGVLINNERKIVLVGSGFDRCGLWQLAFKVTCFLNLFIFKSHSLVCSVNILMCIKFFPKKHLVFTVKQDCGIPCVSQSLHRTSAPALQSSQVKNDGQ